MKNDRINYMSTFNPYSVLGISKTADNDTIKKAYRLKSMKVHPDRNSDPEAAKEFEQITHAKDMLLDEKQRKIYDNGGWRAVETRANETRYKDHSKKMQKCPPVEVNLKITLSDIYFCRKQIAKIPLTHRHTDGSISHSTKKIPVPLDTSFDFSHPIKVEGGGNTEPDKINGDIIINLVEVNEVGVDKFEIDHFDLIYYKKLTLEEMSCGYSFPIKHPEKGTLLVKGKAMNREKMTFSYDGYGLPMASGSNLKSHGNLIVKIEFDFSSLERLARFDQKRISTVLNKIKVAKTPDYTIPSDATELKGQEIRTQTSGTVPDINILQQLGLNGFPQGVTVSSSTTTTTNRNAGIPNGFQMPPGFNRSQVKGDVPPGCAQQ